MARQKSVKEYKNFVKGLITEASPLIFPENASIDEDNFRLLRDGSRRRRYGIDYEQGYQLLPAAGVTDVDVPEDAISVHEWKNAANSGINNFVVIQIGGMLYIHDMSIATVTASTKHTVDLSTYQTSYISRLGAEPVQTAIGKGFLFVVSNEIDPFYITYDQDTDTFSETAITIEIRDFLGIDDSLALTENPGSLSVEHEYNIKNRGWYDSQITSYYTSKSVYPDKTQIWFAAKDTSDNFDPSKLDKIDFGNSSAPYGRYILNAFYRDRDTASGLTGIPTDYDKGRPTTVEFFAGRVFYSGVVTQPVGDTATPINGYIYFSQQLETMDEVGYCYQTNDPTSEINSDIYETDGGVIKIPGAGQILRIVSTQDSLIVVAENGVWQISGQGDGFGFTAISYQVKQITNVGALGANAVINVEGSILYWSASGIYTLNRNQGQYTPQNMTEQTIQTLYLEISSPAKQYAQGTYDPTHRTVMWLYSDDPSYLGTTYRNKYNRALILDTVLGAFYTYTFGELSTDSPWIAGAYVSPASKTVQTTYQVVNGGVNVTASTVPVEVSLDSVGAGTVNRYFITLAPQSGSVHKYTVSWLSDTTFYDWMSADGTGISFDSYLITGYETFEDTLRYKEIPYLIMHFHRTETGFVDDGAGNLVFENPSSCLVKARWDFSDSDGGNLWGEQFQAYRFRRNYIPSGVGDTFDYGQSVITTKSKLRGRGRAISLDIISEAGKDCYLLGWGWAVSGGDTV